jgi:predicted dehydrogenase
LQKERIMDHQAPIRIGLVGCGWHGSALAQAIVRSPSLRLAACADPNASAARAAAANAADISTHDSVEALLAESDVNAIVIATPHHLLAPIALAALRAGKHVLAEKPIALNEREAIELEAEAARSGVCYMSGYSFRFSMGSYLHNLVVSGATGKIRGITGAIGCGPLDDGWVAYPEMGGGPLLYLGSHMIDLALWLLADEPVEVYAHIHRRPDTGADDTTTLQISFAQGALAQFIVTQASSSFFYELGVHGAAGTIGLRGHNFLQFEVNVRSTTLPQYAEPTVIRPAVRRDNITMMLVPELEEFAAAISARRPPSIGVADGRQVLRILDAVTESGRTGQPVALR